MKNIHDLRVKAEFARRAAAAARHEASLAEANAVHLEEEALAANEALWEAGGDWT